MAKSKKAEDGGKSGSLYWVGLGASAGGLEALRGLVHNLPKTLNATYIVAQHMAPHHRSMLTEIIGRETGLPVLDVTDGLKPRPNTIYITPPNHNIVVEGNCLRLIDPSREPAAPKPSVDRFFSSLAEVRKDRAVAIILSGTGSDGARGVKAVRAAGGITIAQDEATSKYTGMPVAAVETGAIDLVMSPEEIGVQFQKIIAEPRDLDALKASPLDMDSVSELTQLLMNMTRVNFRQYKTATFQRRVERRMAALDVSTLEEYVAIAKTTPREVEALFRDLLISVTSFFRDPPEFDALKTHIAAIVKAKKETDESIRIWVAGTATGEEAYSIAILLAEALGGKEAFSKKHLQIFATDIDDRAIEIARRGFYPETALDKVDDALIDRYFERAPAGYTVCKALREKIVFSMHNLAQDPPFLNVDLVSCRNLMIYFQAPLQAQVFARFHYALVPNGVLFLGKSEAISTSDSLFRVASPDKHIFYQRPSQERKPLLDPVFQRPFNSNLPRPSRNYPPPEVRDLAVSNARFNSLVSALGPNALLMSEDLKILKSYGNVDRYVGLSAGDVNTSASSLLRDPYRHDIRAAVPPTLRNKSITRSPARAVPGDPARQERVIVYPIDNGPDNEITALVVFAEWEVEQAEVSELQAGDGSLQGQVNALSQELAIARSNLQQTVEELETSNEELQALNEELQSSNEELQSTNEELETSNEELQSTNEELSTVNEELQVNSQQLNSVNQSLNSVLENVAIPMLVVDRSLNITNVSRACEGVLGISPDNTLPHISRCRLPDGYPNLIDTLNKAMETGQRIDQHIDEASISAILTTVPHFSAAGELIGAIVLLNDNTEELKRTRNELQLIFDIAPAAIMVRDGDGRIIALNKASRNIIGAGEEDDVIGTNLADYQTPESFARINKGDRETLKSGKPSSGAVYHNAYKDGREPWVRVSRTPAAHPASKAPVIYAVTEDTTSQHEAAEALALSKSRLDQAVRASGIGLWDWDVITNELYWSDRFKEIVGATDETFTGKLEDFADRLHPDDKDATMAAVQAHLNDRAPYNVGYRLRHTDGSYRWIQAYGEAIWDEDGKPARFIGTVEDITDKRLNNFELRERNEQLALASRLSGTGYWKVDLADSSVFWSEQVYAIHGVSQADYQPELESAIDFYHPDDVDGVRNTVARAVDDGRPFDFEARLVRPSGEIRFVHSVASLLKDEEGKVVAIFGVFRDITEDREREARLNQTLEELSRSNEELNRFSYVCSHDMKEPVRMIEAMTGLLRDPKLDDMPEKREELLSRIASNMARLRAIIDSLLAYSRIDAKVEITDVDLNSVLAEIHEGLSLVIKEKQANLTLNDMPVVHGARVHFSQLFQNLIGNALKFSDKDRPEVAVSSRRVNGEWLLQVEDNGPGIPEEFREEVFGLFRRLKRRDEIEGTGLGLSISQRIVSQYGGTIQCRESNLGGAQFEIALPVREEQRDQSAD